MAPDTDTHAYLDRVEKLFAASTDYTIGLEEEYQILDPGTLGLASGFELSGCLSFGADIAQSNDTADPPASARDVHRADRAQARMPAVGQRYIAGNRAVALVILRQHRPIAKRIRGREAGQLLFPAAQ